MTTDLERSYRRVFLGEGRQPTPDGAEVLADLARHCLDGLSSLPMCGTGPTPSTGSLDPLRMAAYEGARGVLARIRYMLAVPDPEAVLAAAAAPDEPRRELD